MHVIGRMFLVHFKVAFSSLQRVHLFRAYRQIDQVRAVVHTTCQLVRGQEGNGVKKAKK